MYVLKNRLLYSTFCSIKDFLFDQGEYDGIWSVYHSTRNFLAMYEYLSLRKS